MASRNEIAPDPEIAILRKQASDAKHAKADKDTPADLFHKPPSANAFTHNKLDASDLVEDLTESFDDENALPRQ